MAKLVFGARWLPARSSERGPLPGTGAMADFALRTGLGLEHLILLLLLLLGLVFFAQDANLQLASDDLAWLQGEAPTVFDQYRTIPRLFFVSLHALFGPSAIAALVMIIAFHLLNAWLVYRLGKTLLQDSLAALIAVAVFLINPITLSTLTWISCFSYVQGTTLALLALSAFCRVSGSSSRMRLLWSAAALICFGAGLFCSHEVFFLPAVFLVVGWLRGEFRWGMALFLLGMACALLVNLYVYDFGRHGVEASRLFSLEFGLAYLSSSLSSGLALGLAYPLSFFAKPLDFLRVCFSEPVRWGLTTAMLAVGIAFYRNDRAWRLNLALLLTFLACITPYFIRLFLTPDTVNYHISYALSGRVFYLAFVVIALGLGRLVSWLYRPIEGRRGAWAVWLVPALAYGHALWLYDRVDFLGLSVARGFFQQVPPRWNPYVSQQPAWLLLAGLAMILGYAWRSMRIARPFPADERRS